MGNRAVTSGNYLTLRFLEMSAIKLTANNHQNAYG